jgi:glycosyltransferase involved in cell wall biosynthesis
VIKNGVNGILLESGKVFQLASGMIELARDKEKSQRLAQQAYQDVCTRFSDTGMARKYKKVYEEVLWK